MVTSDRLSSWRVARRVVHFAHVQSPAPAVERPRSAPRNDRSMGEHSTLTLFNHAALKRKQTGSTGLSSPSFDLSPGATGPEDPSSDHEYIFLSAARPRCSVTTRYTIYVGRYRMTLFMTPSITRRSIASWRDSTERYFTRSLSVHSAHLDKGRNAQLRGWSTIG